MRRAQRLGLAPGGLLCSKGRPMIGGLTTFTLIHVVLSIIGIFAGFIVAGGLIAGKRLDRWTGVFLVTTGATSVTGFRFPFLTLLPPHPVAIISLVALAVATPA